MTKNELNAFYRDLELKTVAVLGRMEVLGLDYDIGYYNGHYFKNSDGEYEKEYYPIPVISVKGACDIELEFDRISVSAKLSKRAALHFDYGKISAYRFEAYGIENYLDNYYEDGDIDKLLNNIKESKENAIGFQFEFDRDTDAKKIMEFVEFLRKNGFYY
ncbi:MAG: hypothetical protein NC099_04860 [Corallococcus sp.]|nr:hypothetical protein [Bacillota bacterium]MCM1533965.1 hypothetical protein [Corallococcus sp.]